MRRPRLHIPGACYHVTLRGNHQQDIFFSEADRQLLSLYVAAARERTGVRIHAYCWMSNHIHLLIQVADAPLGAFMQRIGTRYARAIQARVPTTGHLFQNRYHALLVDVDRYFVALLRYIHLNPVRAGLVADPAEYLWSSHCAYLGRTTQNWLTTDFGLTRFAATEKQARERYQSFVMQALGAPRDPQLTKPPRGEPRVLGDESFAHQIAHRPVTAIERRGLDEIVDEVCRELGVSLAELQSPSQLRRLSRARGQVTSRALAAGAASLSEVAKRLNRSASALTRVAERYGLVR
jgi:REP element-mobilizing transposase RayT